MSGKPTLDVDCHIQHLEASGGPLTIEVELRDGDHTLAKGSQKLPATQAAAEPMVHTVHLDNLGSIKLWDLQNHNLYTVHVRLLKGTQLLDSDQRRIGFRHAEFTDQGFELNGKVIKLRGLNRHQTFPYVGQAMPARVNGRDAKILRNEMTRISCARRTIRSRGIFWMRAMRWACWCSRRFLAGSISAISHGKTWRCGTWRDDPARLEPSVDHSCGACASTNRRTITISIFGRTRWRMSWTQRGRPAAFVISIDSELLEDVFTMNDFGFPLKPPNHPLYLNTEFVGHTYSTKRNDQVERVAEHTLRHARMHNQLASDDRYAGGIGWCAFDYNTHGNFGSGDRICYHGVSDIFRMPKAAAGFYKSQCDPAEEIVLEPAFNWARGDETNGFTKARVCSNCEQLKFYIGQKMVAEVDPTERSSEI